MTKSRYSRHEFDKVTGKWYGIDKYGIPHELKRPPKTVVPKRKYSVNQFHAGWIHVSEDYKYSFPKGVVKKNDAGKYLIGKRFSKEQFKYQPFSALNARKSGLGVIKGKDFPSHISKIVEKLSINSQNFTIILSLRAKKIFQDSFKYKRFYSAGGDVWKELDEKTIKKRRRRGTWPGAGGILAEYGNLFHSIDTKTIDDANNVTIGMRVYTGQLPIGRSVHRGLYKRGAIPIKARFPFYYGGIHNEGGRIRGGHRLPRRQFMGHSSYFFDFAEHEINKYLFYNVFD